MSEEEKDIEYLEKYINWETYGERSLEKAIKTILDLYKAEKRKSKIKHEYLKLIYELGVDYDGCEKAESLKDLIDELVGIAVKGMENDDKSIIYEGMTPKNILLEDLRGEIIKNGR